MRRLSISIVQGPYYPVPPMLGSGAEKVWFGLGQEFARCGHVVVHLSRQFRSLPAREVINGVQHQRLPSRDAPGSKLLYRGLDLIYSIRVLKALPIGADIVVTNCIWLPLLLRSRRRGALYVHVARYPKGQMRLYRHAARLQAVSTPVAREIIRELGGQAGNVRVIPPYLTNIGPEISPAGGAAVRRPEVLFVGRLHPEKGLHLLIEAFNRLRWPDWRLVLVGPHEYAKGGGGEGYRRHLGALAAAGRQHVSFEGTVEQRRLNDYFGSASVLVYPSLAEKGESFGMVPLEAMACGCPVIVSDLACFRDYLVPGENGIVFDHRADDAALTLAAAIERTMADDGKRAALARRGRKTVDQYSLDKIAGRYLDDFSGLANLRATAGI